MAKKALSPCCGVKLIKRQIGKGRCCSRCGYVCNEKSTVPTKIDIK